MLKGTKLQYDEGDTGIFYHGTSESIWNEIQKEGVLFGARSHRPKDEQYRYTYLTPDIEVARKYGPVILEIYYKPTGLYGVDNYGFNPPEGEHCWQFSVFDPIPLQSISRIE
jgi:hypothetical protein